MMIYLVDIDARMTNAWKECFGTASEVAVVRGDIRNIVNGKRNIDAVCSAGNAFGILDGGLDAVYDEMFPGLESVLRAEIQQQYLGEQPVGASIVVDIPNTSKRMIYTTTMRCPEPLIDPRVIYTCTRTALVAANKINAKSVVLPAFGHLTGRIKADTVAKLMYIAWRDIQEWQSGKAIKNWDGVNRDVDHVLFDHLIFRS